MVTASMLLGYISRAANRQISIRCMGSVKRYRNSLMLKTINSDIHYVYIFLCIYPKHAGVIRDRPDIFTFRFEGKPMIVTDYCISFV